MGKTITNSGSITASEETVGLSAGEELLMKTRTGADGERGFVRATGTGANTYAQLGAAAE